MSSVLKSQHGTNKQEFLNKVEKAVVHTQVVTSNRNIFTDEADAREIYQNAKAIYRYAYEANDIKVSGKYAAERYSTRRHLQEAAIRKARYLLTDIHLARKRYHLRGKKFRYWCELAQDALDFLLAWKYADAKRYS